MKQPPDNIVPIASDTRTAVQKFSAEYDRELLTILVDSMKPSNGPLADA